jgi:hypothetical protein
MSAVLAAMIKSDVDAYAAFVSEQLAKDMAGVSGVEGLTQEVIRSAMDDVRIAESRDYMRPTSARADQFYWPDLKPSEEGMVSSVDVHLAEAGDSLSSWVTYYHREAGGGDESVEAALGVMGW